jgi:predicted aldo/keto reductase-like oxidoreductase
LRNIIPHLDVRRGPFQGWRLRKSINAVALQVRYNLMYQHPSDWHNNTGVIRQAEEQGMGITLMRPLTSGVFQRLMADIFPEIDTLKVGRLLLNYVLSDPYVDVEVDP